MTEPGFRAPLFSAATIIDNAGRSFTLPAGFMYSTLAQIVAPPCGLMRASRTSGVLAIKLSASSATRSPLSVMRLEACLSMGPTRLAQLGRGAVGNAQTLAQKAQLGVRLQSRRRNSGQKPGPTGRAVHAGHVACHAAVRAKYVVLCRRRRIEQRRAPLERDQAPLHTA